MNLGMILPRESGRREEGLMNRLLSVLSIGRLPVETKWLHLDPHIHLLVCHIPAIYGHAMHRKGPLKRLKRKLDRMFSEEGVLSVIEHPAACNLYGSEKTRYEPCLMDIAVGRFTELLGIVHRGPGLNRMEITVTGNQRHLEYAITRAISLVKTINVLIPEGSREPGQAEEAFEETGIPVHITSDPEVLNRTPLWIRFPNDHESFDCLPAAYTGRIIDLGALKVIDTRAKRVYGICLELPMALMKELGPLPDDLRYYRLPGFLAANCANAWGESAAEASLRLDMRLIVKP